MTNVFQHMLLIHAGMFVIVIFVLIAFLFLLFIFIAGYVIFKNSVEKNKRIWHATIGTLISEAMFDETTGCDPGMSMNEAQTQKLLSHPLFRQCLINEIIQVRKNITGSASSKMVAFYESLQLDRDSAGKLQSLRWHIKAKGIQELSLMDQKKYVKELFRLSNNNNELIRNEAQSGLVSFYGFRGLRFLNVATQPLSQWQQIQLLNKLSGTLPDDISIFKLWLKSPNDSVMVFALKMAVHYHCTELYEDVTLCFQKISLQAKLNALDFLKKMPQEDTGDFILTGYHHQDKIVKLEILKALKITGKEKHINFLITLLSERDAELNAATLDVLSILDYTGGLPVTPLLTPPKASFHLINSEHAA